ncbi:MAG: Do family serine endopeptidase [Pseudomonadota bacterium]
MKRKEFLMGAAFGLALAAGATAGGVIQWPGAHAEPVHGRLQPSAGRPGLAFAPPQGAPLSFADIFQQVAPAVVQIDVKTRIPRREAQTFRIPGTPFEIPTPEGQEGEEQDEGATALGAGSGFFISADGYIVTNNHVVENAEEITVKLSDEREYTARLIGRDESTDLAVIKIEGRDFPFVVFEETAEPRVGDWVIAVGNPFGLGGTATAGIVSARGRDVDSAYVDYLQIDAAINRGNSGGPTFDIYGRVIGVNSAIFSPGENGGSVGIGFAIPASTAKTITDRLMRGETIQRGYLGVGIRSLTADQWEALGHPRDFKGAYIETVTADGPAARGGVEVGDFVVAVNGRPVSNGTEVTRAVGAARPGETIRLDIIRDGRRQTLNVRSGTRPSERELLASDNSSGSAAPNVPAAPTAVTVEGLTVAPLTDALRQRYGVPESVSGVVVMNVQRGTAASRLGFTEGFVITSANNRPVATPEELRAAVAAVRGLNRPGVLLFVRTPQGSAPVVLELPKAE